jgi:iron complex transport system substrate-binding protein
MAPQGLDSIARDLRRLGQLSGHAAQAEQVASDFQQVLQTLRERYAGARAVRVFLQISEQPLYTLNGRQVISEALGVCGGVNVFAELPELAAPVSFEAVIAADPDVIIATSDLPGDNPARRVWQAFPMLRAVQHAQLFAIDADLLNRPTPRMLRGIEQVCDLLQQARRND